MRELSGADYDHGLRIMNWPMREAFLAYLAHLRRLALEEWRWARLEWASLKPCRKDGRLKPAPKMPPILKDDHG